MVGLAGLPLYDTTFLYEIYTNGVLLVIAGILSTPVFPRLWKRWVDRSNVGKNEWMQIALQTVFFGDSTLATAYLVDDAFNPFLYFRF